MRLREGAMQLHLGQRIRIVVNGEAAETGAATLAELVAALGYNESQVATALNGDFVARGAGAERARGNAGVRLCELSKALGVRVMPNTAGCGTPKEAIATAQMARELFGTDWVELEVIGNDDTLQRDLFGLVESAAALGKDG